MSKLDEKRALFDKEMEIVAEIAATNGCRVTWSDSYGEPLPFCGCEDELHYSDQQSSRISHHSAKRVRVH